MPYTYVRRHLAPGGNVVDLQGFMLSAVRQRMTNTVLTYVSVEY